MDFRRFKLRFLALASVAVFMAAGSSEAKPPVTNAWQSIVFSSPSNSESSSNLTYSLPQQPSSSLDLQSRLQIYQDSSPVVLHGAPSSAPVPVPGAVVQVHKPSNDDVAWEFMTPAQILGVAPDQILQTQEHNANSDQSGLTRLQRLLLGGNPSDNFKAAAAGNVTASASQDFWFNFNNNKKGIMAGLINSSLGNLQSDMSGPSANDTGNNNSPFAGSDDKSAWSKLFGLPSSPPAPNSDQQLQQQEEMKQFMQLLNPGSVAAATTTSSSDETTTPETANPFMGFDSTKPLANPLGNPFASLTGNTSLTGGIGKPAGLAPLPAITQQANNQSAVRPAWAPQPPPWLSPTPQPFAIPHSKF